MSDVDRLLKEFIRARAEQGEADPSPYLNQVEGTERRELMALIDGYLARDSTPRRQWSPEGYRGSRAEAIVSDLQERYLQPEPAGMSLRELRARADLKRADVVAKLSEWFSVPPAGRDRVAYNYHRMESGLAPAESVSEQLLGALSKIFGEEPPSLRSVLRSAEKPQAGPPTVFARTALTESAPEAAAEDGNSDDETLRLSDENLEATAREGDADMATPEPPEPPASTEPDPAEALDQWVDGLFFGDGPTDPPSEES